MHQGAESHPIAPAGREVLDVNVLQKKKDEQVLGTAAQGLPGSLQAFCDVERKQ